jgi:hypothetical protein
MRSAFFFFLILCFLTSCNNSNKNLSDDPSEKNIKNHAISVAEIYAKDQLKEAKKTVSEDGLIVLSNSDTKCLIDPSKIVTGEIDEDTKKDAIVPLYVFRDQKLFLTEHLILINKDGKFVIAKVLDSEMKIMSITDRVIFIETSKVSSDSPTFGCEICKEIVRYQFRADSLIKLE